MGLSSFPRSIYMYPLCLLHGLVASLQLVELENKLTGMQVKWHGQST
jgi:hypothetical protein